LSEQNRNIIHGNESTLQMPDWQNQLANAIKDPEELLKRLQLDKKLLASMQIGDQLFPLRVTESYLSRIKLGDSKDPLLRQILPIHEESAEIPGYANDPVGDKQAEKAPGLIHKYHGRVLLTLTGACGIHCRYCFRRHFDYSNSNPGKQHFPLVLDYIKNDASLFEVILSGGDPLSLNDQRLQTLTSQLDDIEHIKIIRIHTRQVIVLPDRVNQQLLDWLNKLQSKAVMVIHVNHPNEIDDNVSLALLKLKKAGVELLNQSVLLSGVNDDPSTLVSLSLKLFENDVRPYYIHLLDKARGTAHFDVEESQALKILDEVRKRLPGYLVPGLTRETAKEPYKTPIW